MLRFVVFALSAMAWTPAWAHEQRPALVDVQVFVDHSPAWVRVTAKLNLEAVVAGISPKHADTEEAPQAAEYNRLRLLSPDALERAMQAKRPPLSQDFLLSVDGSALGLTWRSVNIPAVGNTQLARLSEVVFEAELPSGAKALSLGLSTAIGDGVVRFQLGEGGKRRSHWLKDGVRSPAFALRLLAGTAGSGSEGSRAEPSPGTEDLGDGVWDYIRLGFLHIVPQGLDHILFVLGLFLLAFQVKPMLWQITAFTVAHSITLGLSLYGLLVVPSSVVEPLVALSIAYVGVENLLTRRLTPWRPAVVFGFGLLHGLGFAGVLLELGLDRSDYFLALVSFNVGVELGQISVLLSALLLVVWFAKDPVRYRRLISIPGSLAISLIGGLWFVERLMVLL